MSILEHKYSIPIMKFGGYYLNNNNNNNNNNNKIISIASSNTGEAIPRMLYNTYIQTFKR